MNQDKWTRKQALLYLRSSGYSPEQVRKIEEGLREFDEPLILNNNPVSNEKEISEDLPMLMKQHFAVLECLLELASVAGDLYILEKPNRSEMSPELFLLMEELTKHLKAFNEAFCFEF